MDYLVGDVQGCDDALARLLAAATTVVERHDAPQEIFDRYRLPRAAAAA
jgi:hypothetical protein